MNWIKRHVADCKNCCAVYEYLRSSDRYDAAEKKKENVGGIRHIDHRYFVHKALQHPCSI